MTYLFRNLPKNLQNVWKNAIDKSIFAKMLTKSYRSLSSISCYCNVMERIIVEGLIKFINDDDIISSDHHGFSAWSVNSNKPVKSGL